MPASSFHVIILVSFVKSLNPFISIVMQNIYIAGAFSAAIRLPRLFGMMVGAGSKSG